VTGRIELLQTDEIVGDGVRDLVVEKRYPAAYSIASSV
jgi:hypothetical protein